MVNAQKYLMCKHFCSQGTFFLHSGVQRNPNTPGPLSCQTPYPITPLILLMMSLLDVPSAVSTRTSSVFSTGLTYPVSFSPHNPTTVSYPIFPLPFPLWHTTPDPPPLTSRSSPYQLPPLLPFPPPHPQPLLPLLRWLALKGWFMFMSLFLFITCLKSLIN